MADVHPFVDVSVVTPTFCREREVCDAVRSVLAQQGVFVEIIVVDDSERGTARHAVEAIADSRIRYVKRDVPSGGRPALARNDGARFASGRYVCFLDDDDQLLPDCLRAMVDVLDHNRRVGVAIGRVVSFGSDADLLSVNERWARRAARIAAITSGRRRLAAAALLFDTSFTSGSLIRREHIAALGGYDPSVPLYEDVEFYTRAIRAFGHVFVDQPMLYRRTGERSLTQPGDDTAAAISAGYGLMHRKYRARRGWLEYAGLRTISIGLSMVRSGS